MSKSRWVGGVAAIVLAISLPAAAHAQNPQDRMGFWFNAGLGYGSLGQENVDSREGGLSGGLQIGTTLSQKLLIGAGANAWRKSENGATLTAATYTALVRFYPSATGGFFLNGGLGIGRVDMEVEGLGSAAENGLGVMLGLGYDFRVGRNVSVTPFWNGAAISNDAGSANFGQIGLGLTVH